MGRKRRDSSELGGSDPDVGMWEKSSTTAIAVLLSLDLAATLLLLGAQVIFEYERVGRADQEGSPQQLRTN